MEQSARYLQLIHGTEDQEAIENLFTNQINPRTVQQRGPEWFADRLFAITSSTACQIVEAHSLLLSPNHTCVDQILVIGAYLNKQVEFQINEEPADSTADLDGSSKSKNTEESEEVGGASNLNQNVFKAQDLLASIAIFSAKSIELFKEKLKELSGEFHLHLLYGKLLI